MWITKGREKNSLQQYVAIKASDVSIKNTKIHIGHGIRRHSEAVGCRICYE